MKTYYVVLESGYTIEVKSDDLIIHDCGALLFQRSGVLYKAFSAAAWMQVYVT